VTGKRVRSGAKSHETKASGRVDALPVNDGRQQGDENDEKALHEIELLRRAARGS